MSSLILVAEEIPEKGRLLQAFLSLEGYTPALSPAGELLEKARELSPKAVLIESRGLTFDGCELCARIRETPDLGFLPVGIIGEGGEEERAQRAGAVAFIPTPLTRKGVSEGLRVCLLWQERTIDIVVTAAARLSQVFLEPRVPGSWEHSFRVAKYGRLLGRELHLPPEEMLDLYWGGLLHDIGKLGLRDSLLLRPGPLGEEERRELVSHPLLADSFLSPWLGRKGVREALRHHHERYDGLGYPSGLKGEGIPLLARILAIADFYDALTSPRPYHKPLSPEAALRVLEREADSSLDPYLFSLFLTAMGKKAPEKGGILELYHEL